jgi:hypothetical protein
VVKAQALKSYFIKILWRLRDKAYVVLGPGSAYTKCCEEVGGCCYLLILLVVIIISTIAVAITTY